MPQWRNGRRSRFRIYTLGGKGSSPFWGTVLLRCKRFDFFQCFSKFRCAASFRSFYVRARVQVDTAPCEKPYVCRWLYHIYERSLLTSFVFPHCFAEVSNFSNIEYITRSPHAQTKSGGHFAVHTSGLCRELYLSSVSESVFPLGIAKYMFTYFDVRGVHFVMRRDYKLARAIV